MIRTARRVGLSVMAVAMLAGPLTLTAASADEYRTPPIAREDHPTFQVNCSTGGTVSMNVRDNDSWDEDLTAKVTAFDSLDLAASEFTWTPDGHVTFTFQPISWNPSTTQMPLTRGPFTYRLTDSAGQHADAIDYINLACTEEPPSAAPDLELPDRDLTYQQASVLPALPHPEVADDKFANVVWDDGGRTTYVNLGDRGALSEVQNDPSFRVEIVQSEVGAGVEVGWRRHAGLSVRASTTAPDESFTLRHTDPWDSSQSWAYTPLRLATVKYRACVAAQCGRTATLRYHYTRARVASAPRRTLGLTFWDGGPAETVIDPVAEILDARNRLVEKGGWALTQELLADAIPSLRTAVQVDRDQPGTRLDDPSRVKVSPGVAAAQIVWRDAGGATLAALDLEVVNALRPPTPTALDDEVWVAAGDSVGFYPYLNDGPPRHWPFEGRVVGQPTEERWGSARVVIVDRPTLGETWGNSVFGLLDKTDPMPYAAGSQPGTDTIGYRQCAAYPIAVCSDIAKIKVHVLPRVHANPDEASTDPGRSITIPVLDNDLYNDAPALATVRVLPSSIPQGVTVKVNAADRTVSVTAPGRYAGKTVGLKYEVAEPTSNSQAGIRVRVSGAATGPTARDDHAEAAPTIPVKVDVTRNDRVTGRARISIVKGSLPAGVAARVVGTKVILTADKRHAGQTITAARYRVTDDSGRSDTAKIVLRVKQLVIIVTGSDRSAPQAPQVAGHSHAIQGDGAPLRLCLSTAGMAGLGVLLLARRWRRGES